LNTATVRGKPGHRNQQHDWKMKEFPPMWLDSSTNQTKSAQEKERRHCSVPAYAWASAC
jgi:hypothetical protein